MALSGMGWVKGKRMFSPGESFGSKKDLDFFNFRRLTFKSQTGVLFSFFLSWFISPLHSEKATKNSSSCIFLFFL